MKPQFWCFNFSCHCRNVVNLHCFKQPARLNFHVAKTCSCSEMDGKRMALAPLFSVNNFLSAVNRGVVTDEQLVNPSQTLMSGCDG